MRWRKGDCEPDAPLTKMISLNEVGGDMKAVDEK